jgi:uncharacterized protein
MIIDLRTILQETKDFLFVLEEGWWRPEGPSDPVLGMGKPLRVKIRIEKAGDKYVFDGELEGNILTSCDRCLEPYSHDIKTSFHLFLAIQNPETGEAEIELLEDEMEVDFVEGEEIDLKNIVREQIYLSLPIKSICADSCLGLCPTCGINLNMGNCQCRSEKGHPGFLKLKNLNIEGE